MILNRYITGEFLKPFLFTSAIFSIVVQLGHLFDRLDVFLKNDVQIHIIIIYLFAMLPLWLIQALPICTLIASVVAVGNLAGSGELFCLKSSGISTRQILKPFFAIAGVLMLLTFLLGDTIMPLTTSYGRSLYRTHVDKIGKQKPVWNDIIVLLRDKKRISAKRLDLEKNEMENVIVEEYGDHYALRQELKAQKAEWNEKTGWTFYDGIIRLFSKQGNEIIEEEPFAAAHLTLPERPTDLVPQQILPEELSARELKKYIRKINQLGLPALTEQVQYHLKFAFPFTHLLVLLVGIPIALKTTAVGGGRGKKGFERMKSLTLALAIGFAYLTLITIGQALGESRKLPPWAGIWIANLIFFVIGTYLIKKID